MTYVGESNVDAPLRHCRLTIVAAVRLFWGTLLARRAALFLGCVGVVAVLNAQLAVGDIGPRGEFQTSVTLKVPSYHGLEPRLGLMYSSSAGSGWVGKGWSLSGLSALRRQSSERGLPNWDTADSYALDGQNLVACPPPDVNNSVSKSPSCRYRLPGFVPYATRIENYQRIAFQAADPNVPSSPDRWLIWRTDGVKATYEPGITTVRGVLEWRLSQVEDLSGNTVHYQWARPPGEQVAVLEAIRYGDVEIRFQTEKRPDPISVATGTGLISNGTRLQVIDEFAAGKRIRAYALRYTTNPDGSGVSLLQSVQQYGSDATVGASGISGGTSLPPTTFAAADTGSTATRGSTGHWTSQPETTIPNWAASWPQGIDNSSRFTRILSGGRQGEVRWPTCSATGTDRPCYDWATLDFDGNQRDDYVLIRPGSQTDPTTDRWIDLDIELTQPGGGYQKISGRVPWPVEDSNFNRFTTIKTMTGDVNGDGLDDLTIAASGKVITVLGNESRNIRQSWLPVQQIPPGVQGVFLGDATGDGLSDLVGLLPADGSCLGGLRLGVGRGNGQYDFVHSASPVPGESRPACWSASPSLPAVDFQLADVNGDMKADLVGFQQASTADTPPLHNARIFTAISNGAGSFTMGVQDTHRDWTEEGEPKLSQAQCIRPFGAHKCRRFTRTRISAFWSDSNGDGRSDLIIFRPGGNETSQERVDAWTALSNGDTTFSELTAAATPFANGNVQTTGVEIYVPSERDWNVLVRPRPPPRWLTADFNGDGKGDIARIDTTDSRGERQATLRVVADGHGGWAAMSETTRAWPCPSSCVSSHYPAVLTSVGDVDGDGRDDIMFAHDTGGSPFTSWARLDADVTEAGPSAANLLSGDINGDGRPDLVYPTQTSAGVQIRTFRQTVAGSYEPTQQTLGWGKIGGNNLAQSGWLVADVNCDRRTDLVNVDSQRMVVLLSDLKSSWRPGRGARVPLGGRWSVADTNGDGCDDLVRVLPGRDFTPALYVMLGRRNGVITRAGVGDVSSVPASAWVDSLRWQPLDVDRDGRSDLLHVTSGAGKIEALLARGGGWRHMTSQVATAPGPPGADSDGRQESILTNNVEPSWRVLDVNGDGARDLARVSTDVDGSVLVETLRSHGDGTFSPRTERLGPDKAAGGALAGASSQHWTPADVDRDGRTDLVRVINRPGELIIQAALSRGDEPWALRTWPGGQVPGIPVTSNWRVGDWLGRGDTNAVTIETRGANLAIRGYVSDAPQEQITLVGNGSGATTKVGYSPATSMMGDAFTPSPCRAQGGGLATPIVTALTTKDAPSRTVDSTTTRYACPVYSTELAGLVAWSESWSTHEAARNRPASTEHVVRDVFPSGIVQPVVDETRGSDGELLRVTRSSYKPVGDEIQTDLLARTETSHCEAHDCATSTAELAHDEFGNILSSKETAAGSNRSRRTETTYLHDHHRWLQALPRLSKTVDPTEPDRILRSTLICYDDDVSKSCDNPGPSPRGLATMTRMWKADSTSGRYVITGQKRYDSFGNETVSTDARKNPTFTDYDLGQHLHPVEVCNARKHCVEQPEPWDRRADAPLTVIDANKTRTVRSYDPLGRPKTIMRTRGVVESFDYRTDPSKGTVTQVTTTAPKIKRMWTRSFTDGLGRTYLVQQPGGNGSQTIHRRTEFSDGSSRPYRAAAPSFHGQRTTWETFTYDSLGRPVQQEHADGSVLTSRYYVAEGLTATTTRDESGRERTQLTDGWAALTRAQQPSVTQGGLAVTRYTYDAIGQLQTIADPAGNIIDNDYDTLGRKTSEADPDRGTTAYRYDATGNLRRRTDARGRVVTFAYDNLNRQTARKDLTTKKTATWRYDEPGHGASVGRLTTQQDTSGAARCPKRTARSLTYDRAGNVTTDIRCVTGTTKMFKSTYDPLDRLQTLTYPDGEKLTYGYDGAGHVTRVSGYVLNMQYNARDQVTRADYSNGTTGRWRYDPARGWLDSQTAADRTGRRVFDNTLRHYRDGLVHSQDSTSNRVSETYTYDAVRRLNDVTGTWKQHIAYDDLGNITRNSRTRGTYLYPQGRHCSQQKPKECAGPHAVTSLGRNIYTYDQTGNMTAVRTVKSQTRRHKIYIVKATKRGNRPDTLWSIAARKLDNPLRWREIYSLNKQHHYPRPPGGPFRDPDLIYPGQRLFLPTQKAPAKSTSKRAFTWDSHGQLTTVRDSEAGRILNLHGADGTRVQQQSQSLITKYYGPLAEWNKRGLTKYIYAGSLLVARHQGKQQTWYTLDQLGSPRLTTNKAGRVINRHSYAPFGQSTDGRRKAEPVGYTGHHNVGNTSLIDMLARTYEPDLGRMISADTIIPDLSNPQALNRYSYAYNNPVNYTDPSGHAPQDKSWHDGDDLYDFLRTSELFFEIGTAAFLPILHEQNFDSAVSTAQRKLIDARRTPITTPTTEPSGIDTGNSVPDIVDPDPGPGFTEANTVQDIVNGEPSRGAGIGKTQATIPENQTPQTAASAGMGDVRILDDVPPLKPRVTFRVSSSSAGTFGLDNVQPVLGAGIVLANSGNAVGGYAGIARGMAGILQPGAVVGESMSASSVRFSQRSVNDAREIVESMQMRGWAGPPLNVVRMADGALTTLDNTRLLAAHRAGIKLRVVIHNFDQELPLSQAGRFISQKGEFARTWGQAVINRISRQGAAYRTTYPNGSYVTGSGP